MKDRFPRLPVQFFHPQLRLIGLVQEAAASIALYPAVSFLLGFFRVHDAPGNQHRRVLSVIGGPHPGHHRRIPFHASLLAVRPVVIIASHRRVAIGFVMPFCAGFAQAIGIYFKIAVMPLALYDILIRLLLSAAGPFLIKANQVFFRQLDGTVLFMINVFRSQFILVINSRKRQFPRLIDFIMLIGKIQPLGTIWLLLRQHIIPIGKIPRDAISVNAAVLLQGYGKRRSVPIEPAVRFAVPGDLINRIQIILEERFQIGLRL